MRTYGALVGWTSQDLGERVIVTIESVQSFEGNERDDPDTFALVMTTQQAALLGNYLLQKGGMEPATQNDRTWFKRLFG